MWWLNDNFIISNKEAIKPHEYKTEPQYTKGVGWRYGYSFKHFWSNCHALLGELGELNGIQQLCHHYYLKNSALNAIDCVNRIKIFIKPPHLGEGR